MVAGGGPAGAVAARQLALAGLRVVLADRIDPERHKVGEALSGAAVRLLRSLSLPVPKPGGPHTIISGNLSVWNSEIPIPTDFIRDPDGPGWRLDRRRFDAELRDAAMKAAVTWRPAQLTEVVRSGDAWRVCFDDGSTAHAHWLVDATGRRAAIARRLGSVRRRDAHLVAVYAMGRAPATFQLNRTLIEAAPNGWWYAARLPSGQAIAGLHTCPRDAVPLIRQPDRWRQAMAATTTLSALLAGISFDRLLGAIDACGSQLDRMVGDGWVACGDAAQSFDPISAQGILSALHGGMKAAELVLGALMGTGETPADYARRLAQIRQAYLIRRRAAYRTERRWLTAPFWLSQRLADGVS